VETQQEAQVLAALGTGLITTLLLDQALQTQATVVAGVGMHQPALSAAQVEKVL
jgi:hypothetical protein